jgi:hypothetical protein
MEGKGLKEVYVAPWAEVRGVFLCGNTAVEVSVLTGNITQEAWGSDTTYGDGNADGDLWLGI